MHRKRVQRLLYPLLALPLLAAGVVVATNFDGSDVEALPQRPTTRPTPAVVPPVLPRPPLPDLERPPLDATATDRANPFPTRTPVPAPASAAVDRFGTVRGPEFASLPEARPLPAGRDRARFVSVKGKFSFWYPAGWTVEEIDPGLADLVLLVNNQPRGTRPNQQLDEAFQVKIVYVEMPVSFDPVTLESRPPPSLEQRLEADDTPSSVGWKRLDEVNGRTVLRSYGSEAGDLASVLLQVNGRSYGLSTEDVHSVYFDVLEEILQSFEFTP